jgi:SAM-dependent methyltransferase
MDLRRYSPSRLQVMAAMRTLNYQPFIISNDVQTGVAYSWLHSGDPRDDGADRFVFERPQVQPNVWEKAVDANARLRAMYDDFVAEIARRYPGGSLLDVACNNGYFPVRAEQLGMRGCAGMDFLPHWAAVKVLNNITGTSVKYVNRRYSSIEHKASIGRRYDVVVASAIMCHLPDPLNFLAFLGSVAKEAVFFWGQMIDSDDYLVAYSEPNRWNERPFPHGFDDNTRLSRGLFRRSAELMGFGNIVELPHRDAWLPARWYAPHRAWLCMRK